MSDRQSLAQLRSGNGQRRQLLVMGVRRPYPVSHPQLRFERAVYAARCVRVPGSQTPPPMVESAYVSLDSQRRHCLTLQQSLGRRELLMLRWLLKRRPLRERMIAVGVTCLVLSLAGPIFAGLVNERAFENAKLMMIPGSIVGLIWIGVGLVFVARSRE
jgi:hypothetical protein